MNEFFNNVFVDKNHTILKSLAQNITGKKTFVQTNNSSIYFNNVNLSGNINGIYLDDMIANQVYKNEDSVIDSPVNFTGNITAVNVNFKKMYNGINVTDFVKRVTHFAEFNNIEVAFQNLLVVAENVKESLKSKKVQRFRSVLMFDFQNKRTTFQHMKLSKLFITKPIV